ncbi:TonB-dependent receptor [Telmatobacter sp. DSM 110680]|uniref:TonB-dependent receptor n=1 Tax=Telmatobacter sp. DSM 110680 TaxID=3036704 RepID=A0AAU7DK22_9BACT
MKVTLAILARYRSSLLSLVLLLVCLAGHGQQNSTITGTVLDKNGAAVPGAEVTLTQQQTGFVSKANSNDSGNFTFNGLNVGTYDLKATAKGFDAYVEKGIVVNVSQTTRVDATLTVGSVDQTVTVQSDVLSVQTDSNVVSTLVSEEQITEIATENRNFASLVALGLGVSSTLPDNNTPTSVGASSNISVNGLRQSHNIWLIDGGEADDRGGAGGIDILPSQDAIAQLETLSSNYPPDYGISSGATISLSLKSGSQSYHGEAWEFNRNTAFNANSWQNKNTSGTPTARAKLNYNIFGANIGGPLFIPGMYNKDRKKTFFFWNEEWRKLIQGNPPNLQNDLPAADFPTAGQNLTYVSPGFAKTPIVLNVPTVGDPAFAAKLAVACPTCVQGQPFPGGVIPAGLFDANALAYLASGIVPKPNAANDQFLGQASLPINVRDDVVRVDHRVNDKYQILAHYLHDSVSQAFPAPMVGWSTGSWPTITSTLNNPSNSAAVKLTATINPNLLVEASMNYDGNIIDIVNSSKGNLPSGMSVNKFFNNGSKSAPSMNWGGVYGVQENPGSAPWHNAAEDYEPKVDVSYTMGKHAMKFGASYNRYTKNQKLFLNAEGSFTFGTNTGDPFMDMLLGLSSNYSESQAAPIRHYVNETPSVYAMDTWKVTNRLSLQYGLRYDALPFAYERSNQVANFDPATYLSSQAPNWLPSGTLDPNGPGFQTVNGGRFYLNGVHLAGQGGTPRNLIKTDYNTLQPRVGFSEDVFGNGKTVLRGGFGTFYERLQGNDIYDVATAAPFANTPSANTVYLTDPHTSYVTGAAAATPFFAQGSTTLAQDYKAPAVAQFSLGLQNQVAPSVIWVVQYVGNLAWHQNIRRNINNFPINTSNAVRANAGDPNNHSGTNPGGMTIANTDQLRTYDGFGGITEQENNTNGNYNGFQTGLRVQNRWGLSGEVDYTYSHEIDITSTDDSGIDNPFFIKYMKGSGGFDRRNILSINYIYKLPIFKEAGIAHSVLGGWELAGTVIDETGVPTTPRISLSYDTIGLDGGYTNRPNQSGKSKKGGSITHAFDTSVFSNPIPAWAGGPNQGFGSAGKDSLPGPNRVNFTTSLYKSFAFTEKARFEFRVESFNTFNHTEPNGIGNTLGNSNFGTVTSFYDPRALELGGKLIF